MGLCMMHPRHLVRLLFLFDVLTGSCTVAQRYALPSGRTVWQTCIQEVVGTAASTEATHRRDEDEGFTKVGSAFRVDHFLSR